MFICLKNDYPSFTAPAKNAGLLTSWAERGVLMLNTCLTVRAHEANSHANRGWERFTQKVIDLVAQKRNRGVVFMAWGTPAGKRVVKVDATKHLVLKSVHPSPLSAARGFFTCQHFKLANEWLEKRYGDSGVIDWALVPGNSTKVVKDEAKDDEAEASGAKDATTKKVGAASQAAATKAEETKAGSKQAAGEENVEPEPEEAK
jgi:uracil-DNA glycosylase